MQNQVRPAGAPASQLTLLPAGQAALDVGVPRVSADALGLHQAGVADVEAPVDARAAQGSAIVLDMRNQVR